MMRLDGDRLYGSARLSESDRSDHPNVPRIEKSQTLRGGYEVHRVRVNHEDDGYYWVIALNGKVKGLKATAETEAKEDSELAEKSQSPYPPYANHHFCWMTLANTDENEPCQSLDIGIRHFERGRRAKINQRRINLFARE
jgi:hypothetical protein